MFYRFNDYIKMSGRKKQTIKLTLKVKDSIGLTKIEKNNSGNLHEILRHTKSHGLVSMQFLDVL